MCVCVCVCVCVHVCFVSNSFLVYFAILLSVQERKRPLRPIDTLRLFFTPDQKRLRNLDVGVK